MRICHLIDTLAMGGAEKVAALHARELARRGHEVTLLTYHPGNQLSGILSEKGVRVVETSGGKAGRVAKMRQLFRRERFNVVHAYKMRSAIWGGIASFDLVRPAWFIGQHYLEADPWAVRTMAYLLHGSQVAWIVPSNAAAASVRSSYGSDPQSIYMVPNPVDIQSFARTRVTAIAKSDLGIPSGTPVVSIVANLHPWKNHRMFLRTAQRVLKVVPDAVFLVIGRDQLQGTVQADCAAMGIDRSVRFLGYREDVPRLLEATDLLVVTSPDESFCLALAEACAMGVACVSTENGGAADVIVNGQTGVIVPRDDDSAMATAILGLLDDVDLRRLMGEAGRERVKAIFAIERITDCLEALYREAI